MSRPSLFVGLSIAVLLAFVGVADAGLDARGSLSKSVGVEGTYPVCEPLNIKRSVVLRLPPHAIRPKVEQPAVGDEYGSRTHDPDRPWSVLATVDDVSGSQEGRNFEVNFDLTVTRGNDESCAPPASGQPSFDGSGWYVEPTAKVSFAMKQRYRFGGSIVDYNGSREGHRVPQGGYHALRFVDKLRVKTRYTVCIRGDLESRCWRRRTNSKGIGKVDASVFINDHTASGEISWRVEGRRVARRTYSLIPEGI